MLTTQLYCNVGRFFFLLFLLTRRIDWKLMSPFSVRWTGKWAVFFLRIRKNKSFQFASSFCTSVSWRQRSFLFLLWPHFVIGFISLSELCQKFVMEVPFLCFVFCLIVFHTLSISVCFNMYVLAGIKSFCWATFAEMPMGACLFTFEQRFDDECHESEVMLDRNEFE